jgi:hypothetical protein
MRQYATHLVITSVRYFAPTKVRWMEASCFCRRRKQTFLLRLIFWIAGLVREGEQGATASPVVRECGDKGTVKKSKSKSHEENISTTLSQGSHRLFASRRCLKSVRHRESKCMTLCACIYHYCSPRNDSFGRCLRHHRKQVPYHL